MGNMKNNFSDQTHLILTIIFYLVVTRVNTNDLMSKNANGQIIKMQRSETIVFQSDDKLISILMDPLGCYNVKTFLKTLNLTILDHTTWNYWSPVPEDAFYELSLTPDRRMQIAYQSDKVEFAIFKDDLYFRQCVFSTFKITFYGTKNLMHKRDLQIAVPTTTTTTTVPQEPFVPAEDPPFSQDSLYKFSILISIAKITIVVLVIWCGVWICRKRRGGRTSNSNNVNRETASQNNRTYTDHPVVPTATQIPVIIDTFNIHSMPGRSDRSPRAFESGPLANSYPEAINLIPVATHSARSSRIIPDAMDFTPRATQSARTSHINLDLPPSYNDLPENQPPPEYDDIRNNRDFQPLRTQR